MTPQPISTNDLVARAQRDGLPDPETAARAVDATLAALAECLSHDEALALGAALSHRLAHRVTDADHRADGDPVAFFARVSAREGVAVGAAREHASVVLRALATGLDPGLRARLARALPEALAAMLAPRGASVTSPHATVSHAPPLTTLASGRPGSHHPVSEARPAAAQAHSVVAEANPHGDSKLSSAQGLTQEQLDASLSRAKGLRARPISEARDLPRGAAEEGEEG